MLFATMAVFVFPVQQVFAEEINFDDSLNLAPETKARINAEFQRLQAQGSVEIGDAVELFSVFNDLPEEEQEKIAVWSKENLGVDPTDPISVAGAAFGAIFSSGDDSLGQEINNFLGPGDEERPNSREKFLDELERKEKLRQESGAGIFNGVSVACFEYGQCSLCDILIVLIEISNIILRVFAVVALLFFV